MVVGTIAPSRSGFAPRAHNAVVVRRTNWRRGRGGEERRKWAGSFQHEECGEGEGGGVVTGPVCKKGVVESGVSAKRGESDAPPRSSPPSLITEKIEFHKNGQHVSLWRVILTSLTWTALWSACVLSLLCGVVLRGGGGEEEEEEGRRRRRYPMAAAAAAAGGGGGGGMMEALSHGSSSSSRRRRRRRRNDGGPRDDDENDGEEEVEERSRRKRRWRGGRKEDGEEENWKKKKKKTKGGGGEGEEEDKADKNKKSKNMTKGGVGVGGGGGEEEEQGDEEGGGEDGDEEEIKKMTKRRTRSEGGEKEIERYWNVHNHLESSFTPSSVSQSEEWRTFVSRGRTGSDLVARVTIDRPDRSYFQLAWQGYPGDDEPDMKVGKPKLRNLSPPRKLRPDKDLMALLVGESTKRAAPQHPPWRPASAASTPRDREMRLKMSSSARSVNGAQDVQSTGWRPSDQDIIKRGGPPAATRQAGSRPGSANAKRGGARRALYREHVCSRGARCAAGGNFTPRSQNNLPFSGRGSRNGSNLTSSASFGNQPLSAQTTAGAARRRTIETSSPGPVIMDHDRTRRKLEEDAQPALQEHPQMGNTTNSGTTTASLAAAAAATTIAGRTTTSTINSTNAATGGIAAAGGAASANGHDCFARGIDMSVGGHKDPEDKDKYKVGQGCEGTGIQVSSDRNQGWTRSAAASRKLMKGGSVGVERGGGGQIEGRGGISRETAENNLRMERSGGVTVCCHHAGDVKRRCEPRPSPPCQFRDDGMDMRATNRAPVLWHETSMPCTPTDPCTLGTHYKNYNLLHSRLRSSHDCRASRASSRPPFLGNVHNAWY
ncbi:hypothetical protein CBR_g44613 [Chara braunii]|uniref:Uncharacterized protein n=1 Tax=Chara braunii TaxID=69332 RepID=A0A388LY06_CHABU|nr:hypothetical protein CBR_g44613 [Chara braunii]|eukprot:GBG87155.1 hypothetical protein CBR_g44613 [Chara braunii]